MRSYSFSRHVRERWKARFPYRVKAFQGKIVESLADEFYKNTKQDKSFANNSNFMNYLYEQFGYVKYEFFLSDIAVFVCRDDTLVTVYDKKKSFFKYR